MICHDGKLNIFSLKSGDHKHLCDLKNAVSETYSNVPIRLTLNFTQDSLRVCVCSSFAYLDYKWDELLQITLQQRAMLSPIP